MTDEVLNTDGSTAAPNPLVLDDSVPAGAQPGDPVPLSWGLSDAQSSQLETAIVVAQGIIPLLPEKLQLALQVGTTLFQAVQSAATAGGADITDDQLVALFQTDSAVAARINASRAAPATTA